MRALHSPVWIAAACLAIAGQHAVAQQREANPARASHYAPVNAHPLPAVPFSSSVRAATAEDPVTPNASPRAPLRLAPRSAASRQPLAKPVAPSVGGALGTVAGGLG